MKKHKKNNKLSSFGIAECRELAESLQRACRELAESLQRKRRMKIPFKPQACQAAAMQAVANGFDAHSNGSLGTACAKAQAVHSPRRAASHDAGGQRQGNPPPTHTAAPTQTSGASLHCQLRPAPNLAVCRNDAERRCEFVEHKTRFALHNAICGAQRLHNRRR